MVVNPRQLRLSLEGGAVMGISQAFLEECGSTAPRSPASTSRSYPILKMAEMPDIEVELDRRAPRDVGQGRSPRTWCRRSPSPPRSRTRPEEHPAVPMRPEYVLAEFRDATASSARGS